MRSGNTEFYKKAKSSSLTLKDVFSDVFKKHSIKDGERVFIAGTSLSTPSPENMLLEWRKPWLFVRVLFIGFFVLFLLKVMIVQGFGIYAIAPYVFFAASVMPVAILLFYWEMNIPRNIPIYEVMMMFIVGGIISLILTGYLNTIIVTSQDCWAPVTEEPAKLLASLVFLRKKKKTLYLTEFLSVALLVLDLPRSKLPVT
jgi:RsiW-degrading membrane proteinase PrsW (M82 family)